MNDNKWWLLLFAATVMAVVLPLMVGSAQGEDIRPATCLTGDYVRCSDGGCSPCATCSAPEDGVGAAFADCSGEGAFPCAGGACPVSESGTFCAGSPCTGGTCPETYACASSDGHAVGQAG